MRWLDNVLGFLLRVSMVSVGGEGSRNTDDGGHLEEYKRDRGIVSERGAEWRRIEVDAC